MFKTIAISLAVLILVLLAYAWSRPDHFRVQRELFIKAPPERIYALIANFNQWPAWSPWEKLDPAMQRSLSGAAQGRGAVYAWSGDGKVGQGRMEITDAAAPTRVQIQLDFIKPFESRNTTEFTLQAQDGGTRVGWVMYGPSPFISKLMGVFISMDRMIGKDFELGLTQMKAAAEH